MTMQGVHLVRSLSPKMIPRTGGPLGTFTILLLQLLLSEMLLLSTIMGHLRRYGVIARSPTASPGLSKGKSPNP